MVTIFLYLSSIQITRVSFAWTVNGNYGILLLLYNSIERCNHNSSITLKYIYWSHLQVVKYSLYNYL